MHTRAKEREVFARDLRNVASALPAPPKCHAERGNGQRQQAVDQKLVFAILPVTKAGKVIHDERRSDYARREAQTESELCVVRGDARVDG